MNNYNNISENELFLNRELLENMEERAVKLRAQLGYGDAITFSFEDLITRLNKIKHLSIRKYESPIRPMSAQTDDGGFMIVMGGGVDSRTCKEQLLHEVAHILFDEDLPRYKDVSRDLSEMRADIFVRCFLMPKDKFLEAFINNSDNGELVNINGIANLFDVNDYLVMKRGVELLGWR